MRGRILAPVVGRPVTLVVILLASVWSGCFAPDDPPGQRLAQPTDELPPISSTVEPATPTNPVARVNYSDPGYVMDGEWTVGDAWYYESMDSSAWYQAFRVIDKKVTDGRTEYVVELGLGLVGNPPKSRSTLYINGTDWTRERTTGAVGSTITYTPPAQDLRFMRNGTFEYNVSGRDNRGVVWGENHRAASYYAGIQEVRLAWGGTTFAGRVEHREIIKTGDGEQRTLSIKWFDRRYLNWVYGEFETGPTKTVYVLVGARVGGQVTGHLQEY